MEKTAKEVAGKVTQNKEKNGAGLEAEDYKGFYEMVQKWTINDYCTPGIKAEVIFDMLLSEFIEEIICFHCHYDPDDSKYDTMKKKMENIHLILKEFPLQTEWAIMKEKEKKKTIKGCNRVDYLVLDDNGDKKTAYLIELKTSKSSFSEEQKKRYKEYVSRGFVKLYDFWRRLTLNEKEGEMSDVTDAIRKRIDAEVAKTKEKAAEYIMGKEKYVVDKMFYQKSGEKLEKEVKEYNVQLKYICLTQLMNKCPENNCEGCTEEECERRNAWISLKQLTEINKNDVNVFLEFLEELDEERMPKGENQKNNDYRPKAATWQLLVGIMQELWKEGAWVEYVR